MSEISYLFSRQRYNKFCIYAKKSAELPHFFNSTAGHRYRNLRKREIMPVLMISVNMEPMIGTMRKGVGV